MVYKEEKCAAYLLRELEAIQRHIPDIPYEMGDMQKGMRDSDRKHYSML